MSAYNSYYEAYGYSGATLDGSGGDHGTTNYEADEANYPFTTTDNPEYNFGYYYTWFGATAGTGTTSMRTADENATDSICPANWRLPLGGDTYDTDGSLKKLVNTYGLARDAASSLQLTRAPLTFPRSGYYDYVYGGTNGQARAGGWFSSTVIGSSNEVYYMGNPPHIMSWYSNGSKVHGFAIRCVAK